MLIHLKAKEILRANQRGGPLIQVKILSKYLEVRVRSPLM